MPENCAACGSPVPQTRPLGPGPGRCCSLECVEEQSRALYRTRMREAEGQKELEVFA